MTNENEGPPPPCGSIGCQSPAPIQLIPGIRTCDICTNQVFEELDTVARERGFQGPPEDSRKAFLTEPLLREMLGISPRRRAALQRLRILCVWVSQAFEAIKNPAHSEDTVEVIREKFSEAWAATQGRYGLVKMAQMAAIDLVHTGRVIMDKENAELEYSVRWVAAKFGVRFADVATLDRDLVRAAINGWVVTEGTRRGPRRDFKAVTRLLQDAKLVPAKTASGVVRSMWLKWRRDLPGSSREERLPALGTIPEKLANTLPAKRSRKREPTNLLVDIDETVERLLKKGRNVTRKGLIESLVPAKRRCRRSVNYAPLT